MDEGFCPGGLERNSCVLTQAEFGEYDAIATLRMIISSLSIVGTLTIIVPAIGRGQIFQSKIHPIFVLALADYILACLWIIGGVLWLASSVVYEKVWCLVVSQLTIIAQCITINMTLVYAIMAYQALKRSKSESYQRLLSKDPIPLEIVWGPTVTIVVYAIAWMSPVFIVLLSLAGVVASSPDFIKNIKSCSCWCLPVYGNVLPCAVPRDQPTAIYTLDIYKISTSHGSVIGLEYLVVFILLVMVYYKVIRYIRELKQDDYYEQHHREYYHHGMANMPINLAQSQAKKRVALFLLIFIINGFFNFLLSVGLVVYEGYIIPQGAKISTHPSHDHQITPAATAYIIILALQSLTLPFQGFMNAIVYGWTRRDFVENMALMTKDLQKGKEPNIDIAIDHHEKPDEIDQIPRRNQKNKKKSLLGSSLLQSHLDYNTTTECAESTETDTEVF